MKLSQNPVKPSESLTDDELCAWWAAEGSAPLGKANGHFVYVTQDDLRFVRLARNALNTRGYKSRVMVVKLGSYALRADTASAYRFIIDIILPRRKRVPRRWYLQAKAYANRLKSRMGRGLGKGWRGKLR